MIADAALLLLALPFLIFSAWSDLRFMRLWNRANLAFAAAFLVAGPLLLPLGEVGLRLAIALVVTAALLGLAILGVFGGGDAKYLGALTLWIAPGDHTAFVVILAATLPVSLGLLALLRRWPALRRATPHWRSWRKRKIPMGVGISAAALLYLGGRVVT